MDPWRPNRPSKRDDFEVAIICALTLEADAVIALFDHHWEDDGFSYGKARGDPNAYSIGVIGQHNVVLAHLPGMGKVSAGNIAAFCRMSFPNIKLALLVGICGGAPYYNKDKSHIRLGDVIVSTGIVQYDFGRRFPDKFEIKDSLNDVPGRPNLEIRNLLSKLMTARESQRLKTESWKYLNDLCQDTKRPIIFPGRSKDLLFPADYRHKHQGSLACTTCESYHHDSDPVCDIALTSTCEEMGCDTSQCLQRDNQQREKLRPLVHFGAFATGDTVMKSAKDREYITKNTQAVGFEMESVGVWEVFPCVVIKSVCDYADSHKSKDWQPYAAACAASYAKGFLKYWDSNRNAESISEPEQFRKRIIKSLSYADMNERRNNIQSEAPSSFNWIFKELVEYTREQDLGRLSDQDSDTNRLSDTEWETDTASNAGSGQEESPGAHEDNEAGWETASNQESGQEESLEEGEGNEGSWETKSDERSKKEESPDYDDLDSNCDTTTDEGSETTEDYIEDSTENLRQWRHWDSFIEWLKSDLPVYWITGKPGSGKSTLMKFLVSDSRTPDALKEWKKDTIIIAHFFWKPGSTMQHSFKGLLCSLFRLILKNDQSISHSSLQRMVKNQDEKESPSDWDQRELRDLLLYYRDHSSQPICIFIDALDEISPEQDTLDTLHLLGALVSPTIKICVSSRPEPLLRLHFQDRPSLEIDKLTRPDIEKYSKASIRDSIRLEPQGLKISNLARRIGLMSEGVFLWAVLVTRSLIRGINNGDSMENIDRRLNSTPRDLMGLYRDIVTRFATDRDIYQQSASLVFNLVFVIKDISMSFFEVVMATDAPLLDQYVLRQKSIDIPDHVTKGLRILNTLEAGCAGLLELSGSTRLRPADFKLKPKFYGLAMRLNFVHRSAEEFLLDTEDGRKLWESCLCSREELLIRRTKARLARFQFYNTDSVKSEFGYYSILKLVHVLEEWMTEANLPHEILASTLNLVQRMYERGSILPPLPAECYNVVVPRSPRGQISAYAASSYCIALAKEFFVTLAESERHETAYCIFHNHCTKLTRPGDNGNMLPSLVQFMLNNDYNPNWPGITATSTCKFGSPWLQYLLTLHRLFSETEQDSLTSTQALGILNTIRMFLKSGASLHSKYEVVFNWTRSAFILSFSPIRLRALWSHRLEHNVLSVNSEFFILEINAKSLLEFILVRVHGVIRPKFHLKLPEVTPYMKALAFGNSVNREYFIVDRSWVSDLLLKGVRLWLRHDVRKGNNVKPDNKVMAICSYATDKVSASSCPEAPWPF